MKASIEKLPDSQIEIFIEVSVEEFKKALDKACFDLGKDLEVEGFRKGKAPKEIIENKIGTEKISNAAVDDCVRENYLKAISENEIEPLGQPQIEIVKQAFGSPFQFRAKVSVLPEINLPDYKKIASQVEKREIQITEQEIQRLKLEKEKTEKERLRGEILEKIAQNSKMEVPLILIETEKKRMLEEFKKQVSQILQLSFEDYLFKIKKTEKELLDSFNSEAQKRIKNTLVLKEVKKQENIEVLEKELQEEMNRISKSYPNIDQTQLKDYSKEAIQNEKTLELLESFVKSK